MRKFLLLFLALNALTAAADSPQKLAIVTIAPVQTSSHSFTQEVTVIFKSAAPVGVDISDVTKWHLALFSDNSSPLILHGTAPQEWTVTGTDTFGKPFTRKEATKSFLITLLDRQTIKLMLPAGTLTTHTTSLTVSFDAAQLLWSPPSPTSSPESKAGLLSPAPDKSHSDIYLSGLYSPAIHSNAQYTIDAQARLVKQIGLSHFRLGGIGTISTDKRQTADPDSFFVSGLLQWIAVDKRFLHGRAQGVLLNWDFAGLEFDRSTTTKTFISSPVFEIPLRVYPAPKVSSPLTVSLIPYAGLTTGTNISNALNADGSGTVFRGLAGASLTFNIKTKWVYLSQTAVTSNYTARIPAIAEIFTNTRFNSATGKSTDLPLNSSQVRHHLTNQIDFTIAKPFSITIKHEYGELPPVFRHIDNKVSVGLTVMFQQNNGALAKIDPEK